MDGQHRIRIAVTLAIACCWWFERGVLAQAQDDPSVTKNAVTENADSKSPDSKSLGTGGDVLQTSVGTVRRLHDPTLPNAIAINGQVISGGLPADEQAFAALQHLGVRTVISVDGAKPDVEMARQFGMRYVHLPHGYDGISEQRVAELTRAISELPGPIYIHCHHGKHRSPAAAVAAWIAQGKLPSAEAKSVLEFAGTSPHYAGLYRCAAQQSPIDNQVLHRIPLDFPAIAQVPPLAQAMVVLDQHFEHLEKLHSHAWRAPVGDPDRSAAHQWLLVREAYTELARPETWDDLHWKRFGADRETGAAFAEYQALLTQGRETAERAEKMFADGESLGAAELQALSQSVETLKRNCQTCHQTFRD